MATIKLEEITTQYRSFVPDQVLTAEQLNTIIDYFEDQNRLTRVCLSGVGIVCGLEIKYIANTSIAVSAGSGVTTDGDLVKYEGKTYTHFKLFEDRDAEYPKFQDNGNILELFTSEEATEVEAAALNTLESIANKVVVLYLENYAKEETPCTSIDCDTQGREQVAKIRMLLLNKTDVEAMNITDTVFTKHNNIESYLGLPKVAVKRVILNQNNTKKYVGLISSYFRSINNAPSASFNLMTGITSLFTDFSKLLQIDQSAIKLAAISNGFKKIFGFSINKIPLDIQYRYDVLKDLDDTYEEIKRLLFDLKIVCCPSETSFPKHLLLGELVTDKEYLICRHKFYPSIIIPHRDERLKEIRNLMDRMYHMVNEYVVNIEELIKITPSKDCIYDLSDRSIPYYFKTTNNLIKVWDYNKTIKYQYQRNIGYQTANLSTNDDIQNPLDYCLNKFDFYRIEGHLGRDYRDALKEINEIKVEKGLAFDVKVLSIDETLDDIDITEYNCHFEDLNTILLAFLKEQKCLYQDVAQFFSGFSITEPGKNKYYTVDDFGRTVGTDFREKTETEPKKEFRIASDLTFIEDRARFEGTTDFEFIASQPIVYQPVEVVEESIYTDEDVIGVVIMEAIAENPDREADTLIRVIEDKIKDNVAINELDEETRTVTVRLPYELLTYARATARLIPTTISELNSSRLDRFSASVKELCTLVDRYQKRINTILYRSQQSSYIRRGFESRVELLLNQLTVNCCAAEKIQVLLDDIQKRKEEILAQKTLAKFVEKHPGLEHKAGVQPGGTFIMVYKGKPNTVDTIRPEIGVFEREIVAFRERIGVLRGETIVNVELEKQIKDLLVREDGLRVASAANLPQGTVLADFALPYLCCSDCAPVNFIIPAQKVSLRLPVAFICLDDDTQPILFEVIPEDGEVKADVEEQFNGGVRLNDDNRYVFDAKEVSPELYGTEISFTVNDQFTDAKITVYEKPQFDFEVDAIVYDFEEGTAQVTFSVTGTNLPDGISFEWDFGDGTPNSVTTQDAIIHTYRLETIQNNTVTVSLTGSNGPCEPAITKDIVFEEQEITLLFDPDIVCLGESTEIIAYTLTPPNASITTGIQGITILDGNRIEIDPTVFDIFNETISFSVNGELQTDIGSTITVWKKPQFGIIFSPNPIEIQEGTDEVEVTFTLDNQNEFNQDLFDYTWSFGGDNTLSGLSVTNTFTGLSDSQNPILNVELSVEGDGDPCGPDSVRIEIPITIIPAPIIGIRLEKDDFCINDSRRYAFIVTPDGVDPTIAGNGVARRNNRFEFTPSNSNLGNVPFTVDGDPSDYNITVHRAAESLLFYGGNRSDFFVGVQSDPRERWSFNWEIQLLDDNGTEIDPSIIKITDNIARWTGENISFNQATVKVVVNRFIPNEELCGSTLSEEIVLREIPCETSQFGTVNFVHETLRNLVNEDGGLNTDNPTLQKLITLILEEYSFFSDIENIKRYERPLDETFARFDAFFDNNQRDWIPDNIKTDTDKQFFSDLIQYEFLLITLVTNCADVNVSRYSERILTIFEILGINPGNNNTGFIVGSITNTAGDSVNISREISVTDITRNVIDNKINFKGFLNTINRIDGQ
ncbi:PKD domain-containing protein [Aquimarina sp. 2201CG5-10]|uniref:PKD domain-containing protein n=1 Tax=Aquimarina callyspongiae TaxID=3098150 RepID=UPI002AB41D53|nr:hypothetical protein [Aquimarina sp. 2201CG5-10]MDY8138089.1 hypothetical protein [Aquimarina sp. 2201CG5-10]